MEKIDKLLFFLQDSMDYFSRKVDNVDKDLYFADRDKRNILDKTINDIILCIVDISEEFLKLNRRNIPDTYKITILACHEFFGDIVLKIAPLVKHRNEMIHQYLNVNWNNIVTVKNKLQDIKEFINKAKELLIVKEENNKE